MANVNADGIATPDEGNTVDPEVWSAAMADSISNGIGARLANQEKFIGCFLNVTDQLTLSNNDMLILPYKVNADMAYLSGMDLSGGVLTVSEPGLYSVTANAVVTIPDGYAEVNLLKNGVRHGQSLIYAQTGIPYVAVPPVSAMMNLVPGDTIHATVGKLLGDAGTTGSLDLNWDTFNTLSVAMVSALI